MNERVHVVLLAAGRSSRTGASHKLLARFDGVPLVRRSAVTALAANVFGATAVVGYRADDMRAALAGLPIAIVGNPRYADGLSTSLIAGFSAAPPEAGGVLVMLADQPLLRPADLDRLIAAFRRDGRCSLVVATHGGRRFNPVLISRSYLYEINILTGDKGAKLLLTAYPDRVCEVEIGRAASCDVDDLEAIVAAGGVPDV